MFILVFLAWCRRRFAALFAWRAPGVQARRGLRAGLAREPAAGQQRGAGRPRPTVLLGTLFPLILDALGRGKMSVGPPYFNAVFVPLMAPADAADGGRPAGALEIEHTGQMAAQACWPRYCWAVPSSRWPLTVGSLGRLQLGGRTRGLLPWRPGCCWRRGAALQRLLRQDRQRASPRASRAWLTRSSRAYWGMQLAHRASPCAPSASCWSARARARARPQAGAGRITGLGGYQLRVRGCQAFRRPELHLRQAARSRDAARRGSGLRAAPGKTPVHRAAACR